MGREPTLQLAKLRANVRPALNISLGGYQSGHSFVVDYSRARPGKALLPPPAPPPTAPSFTIVADDAVKGEGNTARTRFTCTADRLS